MIQSSEVSETSENRRQTRDIQRKSEAHLRRSAAVMMMA